MPENSGYPDQTYDSWVVRGVSAYSGGLWLAALRAGEETARALGDKVTAYTYHQLFQKAQQTYIGKLWNGYRSILYGIRVPDRLHDRCFAEKEFTGFIGDREKRRGRNRQGPG